MIEENSRQGVACNALIIPNAVARSLSKCRTTGAATALRGSRVWPFSSVESPLSDRFLVACANVSFWVGQ